MWLLWECQGSRDGGGRWRDEEVERTGLRGAVRVSEWIRCSFSVGSGEKAQKSPTSQLSEVFTLRAAIRGEAACKAGIPSRQPVVSRHGSRPLKPACQQCSSPWLLSSAEEEKKIFYLLFCLPIRFQLEHQSETFLSSGLNLHACPLPG